MPVKYESHATECKYVLTELGRAALKAVAKIIRPQVKAAAPIKRGVLKKNIGTWIKKRDATLQIGVYSRDRAKRKGYPYAFHAGLVMFGTRRTRANPFLRDVVFNNIDLIRITEGKFIKEIEDENRARGLIDEEEEIEDE